MRIGIRVALVIAAVLLVLSSRRPETDTVIASGAPDVVTFHNDIGRTGQNLGETVLTPANVNSSLFGRVGLWPVDGRVDAQPLFLSAVAFPGSGGTHNVLYVATEHDSVYAFEADTGAILWRTSLLGTGEVTSDTRSCGQVTPEIGVTSTPVIDRARGAIYVVAMSKNSSAYFQRIHALDLLSGAELFGGPKTIQASVPGSGAGGNGTTVTFDPRQYKERSALLEMNGTIYTTWASHCDINPYTGWMMSFDAGTLAQTSVLNITPNGSEAAMWNAGGGPAGDALGNFYVLIGNGTFDTNLTAGGFPANGDYGNGFLKISTSSSLAVADYFNMHDTVSQSGADLDLGSGGPMVLPDQVDNASVVHRLTVGAGKDMRIYVANRDSMGKWNGSTDQIYQELLGALGGSVFSSPAYFNHTVYYGAVGDTIRAFSIANARLSTSAVSQSVHAFGYPGTTPAISANGNSNAILWAVENSSPAVLHALDATNLSHELYNSTQAANNRDSFGSGNKFITPTIVNGHVYVGTPNAVAVFSVLPFPPPAHPIDIRLTAATTSSQVTLAWDPSTDPNVTGYKISYGTSSGNYTTTIDVGNVTSSVVTGLTGGQTYFFVVSAYSAFGTSVPSVEISTVVPVACASSVGSTSVSFGAAAGTGSANVTASACSWTASSNVSWVSITSGASGTGNGTVNYSVAANPTTTVRIGTLSIGGASVLVVQAGRTFNATGTAHLIWQNDATRQVTVWFMGAPQSTTLAGWNYVSSDGVPGWSVVASADLDGDGHPDIIWQNDTTRQVTVWFMGGPQGLTMTSWTYISSAGVPGWKVVAAADLNGDGHPDLIWQNDTTRQVTVWYMGGTQGTTMLGWNYIASNSLPGWRIAGVGDFDADGHPDLIWQNDTSRAVLVWYMGGAQGNTMLGLNWISQAGIAGWSVVGSEDFDGDGRPDIVWQNDSTRQATVWYMGGILGNVMRAWFFEVPNGPAGWTAIAR